LRRLERVYLESDFDERGVVLEDGSRPIEREALRSGSND